MAESTNFTRTYTIPADQYNPDDNDRQNNDVRNSAIQQGWHPIGDVSFEGTEELGETSLILKYSVPVVAAEEAETYLEKHPRVDEEAHAALEKAVEGDIPIEEADKELAEEQAAKQQEKHAAPPPDEPAPKATKKSAKKGDA